MLYDPTIFFCSRKLLLFQNIQLHIWMICVEEKRALQRKNYLFEMPDFSKGYWSGVQKLLFGLFVSSENRYCVTESTEIKCFDSLLVVAFSFSERFWRLLFEFLLHNSHDVNTKFISHQFRDISPFSITQSDIFRRLKNHYQHVCSNLIVSPKLWETKHCAFELTNLLLNMIIMLQEF